MHARPYAVAAALCLGLVGCSVTQTPPPQSPPAPASSQPAPAQQGSPDPGVTPAAETSGPAPTVVPAASATEPGAKRLLLGTGETAHLAHFDVTVRERAFGKDGVSIGWKVEVCYTQRHAQQNANDTTRVSTNPWSVQVRDGEGQSGKAEWLPIDRFPRDKGWEPPYETRDLKLGSCQLGWIAVRHGNPDLQWLAIRYAPADFGDEVTWTTK